MDNKETKLCKKCRESIDKKAKKCSHCGARQGIPVWIIIIVVIIVLFIIASLGNNSTESNSNNSSTSNSTTESNSSSNNNSDSSKASTNSNQNKTYGLGDTITFDGLELTFDTTYSFVTLQNRYSDYNGRSVIRLGINVKNVSDEKNSLNMFDYDFFGSQGTELDGVAAYFDETIDYAGDLKPEASYKKYFYILYDGDGKYSIDFDNYSQEISVEFEVIK
jgi:RNA polymerase subunit RPABC4/transcription elongation factor Spt4